MPYISFFNGSSACGLSAWLISSASRVFFLGSSSCGTRLWTVKQTRLKCSHIWFTTLAPYCQWLSVVTIRSKYSNGLSSSGIHRLVKKERINIGVCQCQASHLVTDIWETIKRQLTLEKIVPLSMKIARGSFSMMSFGDTYGQASSMTK